MKRNLVLVLAALVLAGCAASSGRYGDDRNGYYQEGSNYRGDGYYRNDGYYRGDNYNRDRNYYRDDRYYSGYNQQDRPGVQGDPFRDHGG